MSTAEIWDFFRPQWGDWLQLTFFIVIVGLTLFTIISVQRSATPSSWESKWNRGKPKSARDALGLEHGSVTDLWHAVATGPEKLAEIMPGMLLVVGLLGTFIGLGLALNQASSILGQPDALTASAAASSLEKLVKMLDGLGTKFKTSTWGICGFVILKVWSEVSRFEERRLAWVIDKVKELHEANQKQVIAQKRVVLDQIERSVEAVHSGMSRQFDRLIESNQANSSEITRNISHLSGQIRADLDQIHSSTQSGNDLLKGFTQSTQTIVAEIGNSASNMATAASKMEGGADKIANAAKALDSAVLSFETKSTSVLTEIKDGLVGAISEMAKKTDESIKTGNKVMADRSADLINAIDKFRSEFNEVLDKVRESIAQMGENASKTLEQGSHQLEQATNDIANALDGLSEVVSGTMIDVKAAIEKTLQAQRKSEISIEATSQEMMTYLNRGEKTIEKVIGPIEAGLAAISNSNNSLRSVEKKLETSLANAAEAVAHLSELTSSLKSMPVFAKQHEALVKSIESLEVLLEKQNVLLVALRTTRPERKLVPGVKRRDAAKAKARRQV